MHVVPCRLQVPHRRPQCRCHMPSGILLADIGCHRLHPFTCWIRLYQNRSHGTQRILPTRSLVVGWVVLLLCMPNRVLLSVLTYELLSQLPHWHIQPGNWRHLVHSVPGRFKMLKT